MTLFEDERTRAQDQATAGSYSPPAWAVAAAASAPRISPADAAPLIDIFRQARAAEPASAASLDRILAVAKSPAAQALVEAAPDLSRQQKEVIRRSFGIRGELPGARPAVPFTPPAPPVPKPVRHYLYRFYDKCGCLLYVGITGDFDKRHVAHKRDSPWYEFAGRHEVEPLANEELARKAERDLIRAETPPFNSSGLPRELGKGLLLRYLRKHPDLITEA